MVATKAAVAAAVAMAVVFPLAAPAGVEGERRFVDGIAAVVGDEIILESEVDEELYIYQARSGAFLSAEEAKRLRAEIVKQMVEEMLLVAEARRDSMELAPGELDQELDRRVADLRQRHGSEDALEEALAAEGLTLEELKDLYRDDVERRMLAQKVVREEVHSKIDVTWREVEEYYDEHRDEVARMPEAFQVAGIVIAPKVSDATKRTALARMTEVRERLEAGEPFEELARDYSDDPSAERGGDLGVIRRGTMVPEFEDAIFALEPGEVSGIIPTRFGFHIVEVTEKEGDSVRARHILARVAPGPEERDRARAVADSLREVLLEGADFGVLAKEYSDDEASRENGGVLGWFTGEGMAPAIRAAVTAVEPGEIADVVEGESGYYVIKLLAHEPERIASLDEIREDLKDYLFNLKAEEAYGSLIDRLSDEIYVEIRTDVASEP